MAVPQEIGRASFAGPFFLLVAQRVDDGDLSVDFYGLAIEDGWAIAPLADGVERGLDEQRIAGDDLQRFDGALWRNDGVKFDTPFVADLTGEWRIDGFDAVDELRHLL